MAVTVVFENVEQVAAINAALAGYTAHPCFTHNEGEHGDETACDGWGPRDRMRLDDASTILWTAEHSQTVDR